MAVPYWKVTVERPDGDGGWTVVEVFGAADHPAGNFARHLSGDTALAAAEHLLSWVWPVDVAEFVSAKDYTESRLAAKARAESGIADHRLVVEVDASRYWSLRYGAPLPAAETFSVGELRLARVRAAAADLAAARAELDKLVEQVEKARMDVRYHERGVEGAAQRAVLAGVAAEDVAEAKRLPRRSRPGM